MAQTKSERWWSGTQYWTLDLRSIARMLFAQDPTLTVGLTSTTQIRSHERVSASFNLGHPWIDQRPTESRRLLAPSERIAHGGAQGCQRRSIAGGRHADARTPQTKNWPVLNLEKVMASTEGRFSPGNPNVGKQTAKVRRTASSLTVGEKFRSRQTKFHFDRLRTTPPRDDTEMAQRSSSRKLAYTGIHRPCGDEPRTAPTPTLAPNWRWWFASLEDEKGGAELPDARLYIPREYSVERSTHLARRSAQNPASRRSHDQGQGSCQGGPTWQRRVEKRKRLERLTVGPAQQSLPWLLRACRHSDGSRDRKGFVGQTEVVGLGSLFPLFFLFYVSIFLLFKFKLLSNLNFHSCGKFILNFILCHEQYQFGDIFIYTLFLS
jgi:hypothetical protein